MGAIRPSDITVLIPAAGRVPDSVLALSNVTSSAMIPVAGRPVIDWTMRYLVGLGLSKFVVAVAERGLFVEDFVECTFGEEVDVRFITPSSQSGVGATIRDLLDQSTTQACLVVLGDTHFSFASADILTSEQPFVLTSSVDDARRWCVVEQVEGKVTALHDKQDDLQGEFEALIGVYGFPDSAAALAAAEDALRNGRSDIAAILERVGAQRPIRGVPAGAWLDVGNADRQASSHRTLLQNREFNELTIDATFGTITKRSRNVAKFIDEINYVRLLPPDLAVLFPRMLDFSTDWDAPFVKMEYYGYPTLAEVFLFDNVDPAIWEQIFVHLHDIITNGFMRFSRPLSETAMIDMYLTKTHERLQNARVGDALNALISHEGDFVINGQTVTNLPMVWEQIIDRVEAFSVDATGSVIHGDMCLSNILYDLRSRICKLIDPRGNFAGSGVYGDPLYDVAKLYHSIYGLYDFIVADVFSIEIDGTNIDFRIRSRPQHAQIVERFEKVFFATFDRQEILLRTALLFASMPALHYDAPRRQLAMYTRALQLFDEVLRS